MRRSGDLGALLAIALGAVLAGPLYGSLFVSDDFDVVIERRYERFQRERRFERRAGRRFERRYGRRSAPGCTAAFLIDSRRTGWTVAGDYAGVARLTSEGLEVELLRAATTAQLEDVRVREVVVGLTRASEDGDWLVAHRAEPIPLGELERGETREIERQRLLIPWVGAGDLETGWLMVEHVLDDPGAGGTAWTYAHAPREALAPLLQDRCGFR